MKNLKKLMALILALAMVLSLAACGGSSNTPADDGAASNAPASDEGGANADGMNVYFIPKERQEAFWQAVESGAQAAADTLGVTLTIQGDPAGSNTASNQATYVQSAIDNGADAIAFAALDADTTDAVLQDAMKQGIKVVGFDSDPGVEARDYFVNQADPDGIAVACLDDMAANLTEKGYTAENPAKVYVVSTNPTTPNQNTWIESIKKAYYSDYEIVYGEDGAIDFDTCKANTIANSYTVNEQYAMLDVHLNPDSEIIYGGDGYDESKKQVSNTLAANPDIAGLMVLTTNAISATYDAISDNGLKETCIFDGIAVPTDSEAYLQEGVMTEVVLWQAYDLGYLAVNACVAAVNGELDGDTWVSTLSGTDQVEGVSTYPAEGHKINGSEIILGDPATFSLDTISKWKS